MTLDYILSRVVSLSFLSFCVGLITLFLIIRYHNWGKIQKVVGAYVNFLDKRSENDFYNREIEFLIKAGALNLANHQLKRVREIIKKRGMKNPFHILKEMKDIQKRKVKENYFKI